MEARRLLVSWKRKKEEEAEAAGRMTEMRAAESSPRLVSFFPL